jgi:hypothetical protein
VHVLEELPPEAWVMGERADTVSPPDMGTMLSLQGLARLARHVVRNYVTRAPVGVDSDFKWRESLPGQVRGRLAPQYWVWQGAVFDQKSAERYFSGFVTHVLDQSSEPQPEITDITPVLERIEKLLPGTGDGPAKTYMVGIYALWHRLLKADAHRPGASELLARYTGILERASLPAFVVGILTNQLPERAGEEWVALARERRAEREKRRHLELPPGLDAGLQMLAAELLMKAGETEEAEKFAGYAVDELPGNKLVMGWEEALANGDIIDLDMHAVLRGGEPVADEETPADTGAVPPSAPEEDTEDRRPDDTDQSGAGDHGAPGSATA